MFATNKDKDDEVKKVVQEYFQMIYLSSCALRDEDREFDEKHRQSVLEEMPEQVSDFEDPDAWHGDEFDEDEEKIDVRDILPPARFTADLLAYEPEPESTKLFDIF